MSTGNRNIVCADVAPPRPGELQPLRRHCPRKRCGTPLIQALAWAVELHDYLCQGEPEATSFHEQLARLAARFDRAHARALALGLPLRVSQEVRWASQLYRVVLTEDGLEYQAVL